MGRKLLVVDDSLAKLHAITAPLRTDLHFHVVAYPGSKVVTGRITDVHNADRIANNYSIKHPEHQVHVRRCTGRLCAR
jgi:hypothetical protein